MQPSPRPVDPAACAPWSRSTHNGCHGQTEPALHGHLDLPRALRWPPPQTPRPGPAEPATASVGVFGRPRPHHRESVNHMPPFLDSDAHANDRRARQHPGPVRTDAVRRSPRGGGSTGRSCRHPLRGIRGASHRAVAGRRTRQHSCISHHLPPHLRMRMTSMVRRSHHIIRVRYRSLGYAAVGTARR